MALKNAGGVCEPLEEGQQIGLEDISYLNPGNGKLQLHGIEGIMTFYGTPFGLQEINASTASRKTSATSPKPIMIVKLRGGTYAGCGKGKARTTGGAAAPTGQVAKKPIRRLWGKGKGRFRTRGRYSSGTVRGTFWETQDSCAGTLFRVFEGVVSVHDLVKNKYVLLKAGQRYLTKAGPIKRKKK